MIFFQQKEYRYQYDKYNTTSLNALSDNKVRILRLSQLLRYNVNIYSICREKIISGLAVFLLDYEFFELSGWLKNLQIKKNAMNLKYFVHIFVSIFESCSTCALCYCKIYYLCSTLINDRINFASNYNRQIITYFNYKDICN